MTGNRNAWRAPLAGLASVAMLATMGVAASTAGAVEFEGSNPATANNGDPVYTVKYDANGHTNVNVDAIVKAGGKSARTIVSADGSIQNVNYVFTPAIPSNTTSNDKDNAYVFAGWWTSAKIGEGEQLQPGAPLTKDVTLYAHWALKDTNPKAAGDQNDTVTVKFDNTDNLLDNSSLPTGNTVTLAKGDKLSSWQLPKDKDGDAQLLDGWALDYSNSGREFDPAAPVTESVKVAGKFVTGHKVTFKADPTKYKFVNGATDNGGSNSDGMYDVYVKDGADATAPFVVTTSGGAQDGWDTVTEWKVVDDKTKTTAKSLSGVKEDLYAEPVADKTAKAYRVVFQVNDLAADDKAPLNYAFGLEYNDLYVREGDAIKTPALSNDYDGLYKIANWKYNSGSTNSFLTYAEGESVNDVVANKADANKYETTLHATTVLAKAPTVQFTVTFDPNYTGSTPTKVTVNDGDRIAAPADPTRDGFKFTGWNAKADGTGEWLQATTKASADVTYYAQWKLTNRYELDNLLGLGNIPALYTDNSYAKYEAVRAALQKDSEGRITKTSVYKYTKDGEKPVFSTEANAPTGYTKGDIAYYEYAAVYAEPTLTDEVIASYIETLTAAKEKLVYRADVLNTFKDVNQDSPFHDYIWALASQGVVKGYADGTFRGLDGLNRQDFAAFLYRLAGEPEFDPAKATKTFSDVNASTPHYKAILWAASNGIVNGYGDVFKGMDLINRQDAAAMLYRLAGSPRFDGNTVSNFTDVKAGDEANHATAILWAASKGIVRGYTDGSFKGMDTIARQDAAAFLYRTMNAYDIPALYK